VVDWRNLNPVFMNQTIASNSTLATYFTPERIGEYIDLGVDLGLKVIAALAIFFIGKWVSKLIKSTVSKTMAKRAVDPTLVAFGSTII